MANITTYLSDKLLDHATGDVAFTKPTTYLALYTTTPTMPAGTGGTEVTGGSYARVALAGLWAAASSQSKATNANVVFPTATADWGTLTGVGILDALTVGNLLWAGNMTENKVVLNGDTFSIPASELTVGQT